MQALTRMFKALSDETRLSIVALLSWEPTLCVCDLMAVLDIPQPSVSRHMKIMADAGIAEGRREGVLVHYRLLLQNDVTAGKLLDALAADFEGDVWDDLRKRLGEYLAGKNVCCRAGGADTR